MGFLSCLVLLSFLFGLTVATENRGLRFSQCELSALSLQELKNHFGAIREVVQIQDNRTDVIMLEQSVLDELPATESCCFLRHLLRFYLENVFKNYEAVNNLSKRQISPLTNAFLSIKTKLKQCHDQNRCSCGNESQRRYKLILESYKMLGQSTAIIKAFGEIDLLFAWMENFKN